MSLEDFQNSENDEEYCWYDAAYGKLDNYIDKEENDFGKGKENTKTMIEKWNASAYGTQNDGICNDMWGEIQEEVEKGWFVPSKTEWAAFGGEVIETQGIITSNYGNYGLSSWYWSSSQHDTYRAYLASFYGGFVQGDNAFGSNCVRLSATF